MTYIFVIHCIIASLYYSFSMHRVLSHISTFIRHRSLTARVGSGVFLLGLLCAIIVYAQLSVARELGFFRFTGFPGARQYLIVFQNDAERRPTGGFITSYAKLSFHFGLPWITFGDVYDPKLIQPGTTMPDETARRLIEGPQYPGHGFRDGNFDADFSSSAHELIRLYTLGFPEEKIDGVIAINFTAFQNFVAVLPGFSVGGTDLPADLLFAKLEESIQGVDLHDPEALKSRKSILNLLAQQLIWRGLLHPTLLDQGLQKNLQNKHILLWFADGDLEADVLANNWGGTLPGGTASDLFGVIEGNYGGLKSSRYLVRDTTYDVTLGKSEAGQLTAMASARLTLTHRGDNAEPISGYYKGFFRFLTPQDTELTAKQSVREFSNGQHQIFERFIDFNPGESREFALQYRLPSSVVQDDIYRLRLFRQPGGPGEYIRITLKAPQGYLLTDVSPDPALRFTGLENLAVYEGPIVDGVLALKIMPDHTPPGLSWQEFQQGLTKIDLRFNEPLDPTSIASARFTIADANYRNQRTDDVAITAVKFVAPQNIELSLSGVTEECREWYRLTIDGVADKSGNRITDKQVTVVQSLNTQGALCDPEHRL